MKLLQTMLMLVALVVLFGWTVQSYLDTPIVQVSTSHNQKVACVTPDQGEQQITSKVCQKVLRGRYEVEWVR